MDEHLYIIVPAAPYLPVIGDWKDEITATLQADPQWRGWSAHWIAMDGSNGFVVNDIKARVFQHLGPVLVFDCARQGPLGLLQSALHSRTVVEILTAPPTSTDLWEAIVEIRKKHDSGEPFLPRKLIAAVLLVRKLYRGGYWGGTRNKNYLRGDDLANGRGVSEDFKDIILGVENDLYLHGIVIRKGGALKCALNPKARHRIEEIRVNASFDETLARILMRDRKLVSAKLLTEIPSG